MRLTGNDPLSGQIRLCGHLLAGRYAAKNDRCISEAAVRRHVLLRAIVIRQKTQRPVQFEITEQTRESVEAWTEAAKLAVSDFLFPSRILGSHIFQHGNMRVSSIAGSRQSALMMQHTGLTPCGVRKRR
jgi:hypothetical protein